MANLAEALERAGRFRRDGDLPQAEQIYRQVLQIDSNNADVWLALAEVCESLEHFQEAANCYRNVLRLQPGRASAHFQLANLLARQDNKKAAVPHYQEVLRLQPAHLEARTNLAIALAEQKRLDEAVDQFQQVLRIEPGYAKAHHNLGVALSQRGQHEEAIATLREALRLRPDYAEACYNLGNTLLEVGRREEAIESFRRAVQIRPDYVDALNNLGLALTEAGKPAEAVIFLRQAVRLQPSFVMGFNNLGLALADLSRFTEAEACYEQALRLDPRFADGHTNLGSTYQAAGRPEEAVACYELALGFNPESASAHWNRALALLQQGDYERGWPEYEWRWRRKEAKPRRFSQSVWDGSPLEGRTLLVHLEQGLGDAFQFLRYLPLVKKERGGRIVLECHPFLGPLLGTCPGIDELAAEQAPLPAFDVHIPLLSLPALFQTTKATVPVNVPYLFPLADLVDRWRERLQKVEGFKIGIVWQGNRYYKWDAHRSIPLGQFEPVANVPGVRLISLQKGQGADQIRALGGRFDLCDFGPDLDETSGAFLDTAAVMKSLDLVISPDTSIGHLAGALGVPVWLALPTVVDWRWERKQQTSRWYPTMRLFWQNSPGNWEPVFERMAAELRRRLACGPN